MSLRGGELDTHRQRIEHLTSLARSRGKELVRYPIFLLRFVYLN